MEKIKYPSKQTNDLQERSLACLVINLKTNYKNGWLSQKEINLCESIPGWKWEGFTNWVSKEEFIQWCKDNEIKNGWYFKKVWCKENKKPFNIPYNAERVYDDFSWGDISGNYRKQLTSKKGFMDWCKKNGIINESIFIEWKKNNQLPKHITCDPRNSYNFSWCEISGYVLNKDRVFVSEKEFVQWCRDNDILSSEQFFKWCKKNEKPLNIPYEPHTKYPNWKWKTLSQYAGSREREYVSKEKFIQWCIKHGLRSEREYRKWKQKNKKPDNIPCDPYIKYKNLRWRNNYENQVSINM